MDIKDLAAKIEAMASIDSSDSLTKKQKAILKKAAKELIFLDELSDMALSRLEKYNIFIDCSEVEENIKNDKNNAE